MSVRSSVQLCYCWWGVGRAYEIQIMELRLRFFSLIQIGLGICSASCSFPGWVLCERRINEGKLFLLRSGVQSFCFLGCFELLSNCLLCQCQSSDWRNECLRKKALLFYPVRRWIVLSRFLYHNFLLALQNDRHCRNSSVATWSTVIVSD